MEVTFEIILLSLFCGTALGLIFVIINTLIKCFKINKYLVIFIDVIFMLFCTVMSFTLSLAISYGFPRLIQYSLETIGFLSVYFSFGNNLLKKYKNSKKHLKKPN